MNERDAETRRHGDAETRKRRQPVGDKMLRPQGDKTVRQLATAYIEEARHLHEVWAEYMETDPEAGQRLEPLSITGDAEYHRMWMERYDAVLAVLREREDG